MIFSQRWAMLLVCIGTFLSLRCPAQAPTPPYSFSTLITGIDFHFSTIRSAAKGSDIWPVTWAADNEIYTAWGDGNGFSSPKKVSWGVANLEGSPTQWKGTDIFYGPSGTDKGKISGLLAIGNILYGWKNTQNKKYPLCDFRLIRSNDRGRSWTDMPVVFGAKGFKPVSFVNFGPGYENAKDDYVYIAGFKIGEPPHHIYLARVKRSQIEKLAAYEYLKGIGDDNRPIWSSDAAALSPVFTDKGEGNSFPVIIYNAGLHRYILTDCHGYAGQIGIFEGPQPWGPWKTVYYDDHWGNLKKGEYLGFEFPNKWASPDGTQLGMVFSVYGSNNDNWNDACNIMTVTLTTSKNSSR